MSEEAATADFEPVWAVLANMTARLRTSESGVIHTGTPQFRAGAKLYLGLIYHGTNWTARMIGLQRATRRFMNCAVSIHLLENVRPRLIYSPGTVDALRRFEAQLFRDKEEATERAELLKRLVGHQHDIHSTLFPDETPG